MVTPYRADGRPASVDADRCPVRGPYRCPPGRPEVIVMVPNGWGDEHRLRVDVDTDRCPDRGSARRVQPHRAEEHDGEDVAEATDGGQPAVRASAVPASDLDQPGHDQRGDQDQPATVVAFRSIWANRSSRASPRRPRM